jgi:hypothetical protein
MKTAIPAPIRVALCLGSVFAVLGVMLLCSIWSGFASPDPNPSQIYWLKIGDFLALPTKIFPVELAGGFQFLVVFLFWAVLAYFVCSYSIRLLIVIFGRSGRKQENQRA